MAVEETGSELHEMLPRPISGIGRIVFAFGLTGKFARRGSRFPGHGTRLSGAVLKMPANATR